MYPPYIRGLAYLTEKNGPAAAAEFQKFIDHATIVQNFPIAAIARLQLARAYALLATRRKLKPRIRISSRSGKTPTRISRS